MVRSLPRVGPSGSLSGSRCRKTGVPWFAATFSTKFSYVPPPVGRHGRSVRGGGCAGIGAGSFHGPPPRRYNRHAAHDPEEVGMARTKVKSGRRPRNGSAAASPAPASGNAAEVLTLAETAAYLRAAEQDVLRLVREQGLPGRMVGDDWRFLKA